MDTAGIPSLGSITSNLDVKKVVAQAPVPVISGPTPRNQATINVTIDFDDSHRTILPAEIGNPAKVEILGGTVSNKVPQNSPQDTVWLVTLDRNGWNSDINVTVHSGWYQDAAANWNLRAQKLIVFDPNVGGVYLPVDNLAMLAPYVGLAALLAVCAVMIVYVKKRRDHSSRSYKSLVFSEDLSLLFSLNEPSSSLKMCVSLGVHTRTYMHALTR